MTGLRRTYREGGGPLVPRAGLSASSPAGAHGRRTSGFPLLSLAEASYKEWTQYFEPLHRKVLKEYFFLLLCVGLSLGARAQGLINETTLYIPDNLAVHIDGDLGNSGFLQNQGSLYLSGNWRNANVYQGRGKVVMEGSRPQTIFNNKNDLYHFTIDCSGPVSIEDKLPIAGQLDLLNGVVMVGDDDTLMLAQTATVNGGSAQSYVDGAFSVVGAGYKFFPVGKNGSYYPVELLNINAITPVTELEMFESLQEVHAPSAITLYRKIYWTRKTIRGTFISSPVSIGYQIPDGYTNRHQIEIVQSVDVDQEFTPLSDVRVEYGDDLDKVISDDGLTGGVFVVGESIPIDGIPGEFYLSTSLSPRASNPDNHFIKIFGNQLTGDNFQFLVYNRWGLLIYENHSLPDMITKGWDGRAKNSGDLLPAGAYPFILKALTKNGEVVEKKGVISILN